MLYIKGVVQVGIINEPFPPNGCPRLFEIDAHNNTELALQLFAEFRQMPGILLCCANIMN